MNGKASFLPVLIVLMLIGFITAWLTSLKFRDFFGLPYLRVTLGLVKKGTRERSFKTDPETGEEREVVVRSRGTRVGA